MRDTSVEPSGDTLRPAPRINRDALVAVTLQGQIAHPVMRATPYRIRRDGTLNVVPGSGGIVLNRRVGDRVMGLAGDHVEPGASVRNNTREGVGGEGAPNRALLALTCIGNRAIVINGASAGAQGTVVGKHGGVNHVIVDFEPRILARLDIGDRLRIVALGQGMALPDFPQVQPLNLSPRLYRRWGIEARGRHLHVPVTHVIPAGLMGSGLGRPDGVLGDCDIQLSDPGVVRRYGLDRLRFGDLVAVVPMDFRYGPTFRGGRVSIGVVIHSDSHVAGHGPGVTPLLMGPLSVLRPVHAPDANLGRILGLRGDLAPGGTGRGFERALAGLSSCACTQPAGAQRFG